MDYKEQSKIALMVHVNQRQPYPASLLMKSNWEYSERDYIIFAH